MNIKPFLKTIFSKKMLIQYGIGIAFVILALSFTFLWLNISTNHGEEFSVPNFTGLTIEQAALKADELNLRIEVIDSVYNGAGKRGTVLDQNPPPDFKVKSNRKVFITIKSVSPKIVHMPDFIHTTLVQAKADIETYGLRIGKISYEPSIYDNVVLKQQYKGYEIIAGAKIPQGAEIELILGKSSSMGNTITPDLQGLTKEEAELEAAEFMLNIGTVLYDETVKSYQDSIVATVKKQRPKSNISFRPGDEIDIVLSMLTDTITN